MYQSIPAVNIPPPPPGRPQWIRTSFLPSSPGFTYKFMPWGQGFRRGQIFPEMNENLLNVFRGCNVVREPEGLTMHPPQEPPKWIFLDTLDPK